VDDDGALRAIRHNTGYKSRERFVALDVAGLAEHRGARFASTGIHGLNRLNAWWLQLGIAHQRITPASPQENGAHERMHRVLKAHATRPAAANANRQQHIFNTLVKTYNDVRPHEGLDDETPSSRWHPSARPFPSRIIPPAYPGHFEVRRVSTAGTFRLHNGQQFLSQALNNEMIGLEELQDGVWNVIYYETLLGRFDERTRTITGAPSLKKDCLRCPRTKCHLSSRLFTGG
jgi:putative transposase